MITKSVLLVEDPCVVSGHEPLGIVLVDANPPTLLLQITTVIFGHSDVCLEEVR